MGAKLVDGAGVTVPEKSITRAAALAACGVRPSERSGNDKLSQDTANIFTPEAPRNTHRRLGEAVWFFEGMTPDGVGVSDLLKAWEEGGESEAIDSALADLLNHGDSTVAALARVIQRAIPGSHMEFMRAGFENVGALKKKAEGGTPTVKLRRGRSTLFFGPEPCEAIKKRFLR